METDCLSMDEWRAAIFPSDMQLPETEVRIRNAFETRAHPCGNLGVSQFPDALYEVVTAETPLAKADKPLQRWRKPSGSILKGNYPEFLEIVGHRVAMSLARKYRTYTPTVIETAVAHGLDLLCRAPDASGTGLYSNFDPRRGTTFFHYALKSVWRAAIDLLMREHKPKYDIDDINKLAVHYETESSDRADFRSPEDEVAAPQEYPSALRRAIRWERHIWDPESGLMVQLLDRLVGHRPGMRQRQFPPDYARILLVVRDIFKRDPLLFPKSTGWEFSRNAFARLAGTGRNSGRAELALLKIFEFELARSCGQPSGANAAPDRIPEIRDLLTELAEALRELERRYAAAEQEIADEIAKPKERAMAPWILEKDNTRTRKTLLPSRTGQQWRCRVFGVVQVSELTKSLKKFR